ncbi:MAG TPA: tetratricopeptide repeat protein [Oscillatoriaceae cyanobacterium]
MAPEPDILARARRLDEAGESEAARSALQAALQGTLPPAERVPVQRLLVELLIKAQRYEAAIALVAPLARPDDAEACLLHAQALLGLGQPEAAEKALQPALRARPEWAEPHLVLGHLRGGAARWPEAIRCYEEAIRRDSQHVAARYYLAEALIRTGDILRATSQLHYLQRLVPRYVPAILLRGDIALHQGDHRQAIVEYCRAIAIESVDAEIYGRLGKAYLAVADTAQALKAYERAIQADAAYAEGYFEAARLCELLKDWPKARRYYAALAAHAPYRAEAEAGLRRIEAYFEQFDLSRPSPVAETPEPEHFEAPQTFERRLPLAKPPQAGTRPLAQRQTPQPQSRTQSLQARAATRPLSPSNTSPNLGAAPPKQRSNLNLEAPKPQPPAPGAQGPEKPPEKDTRGFWQRLKDKRNPDER